MSLARRVLVLQLLLVLALTAVFAAVLIQRAAQDADERAREISRTMSMALADDPFVIEQAAADDPHAELQPLADDLVRDTELDWVTIMSPEGIRWTHPRPEMVGQRFRGSIEEARSGQVRTSTERGQLGLSARTTAPVRDEDGEIVALVSTGVLIEHTADEVWAEAPLLIGMALAVLAAGAAAHLPLARYLWRRTGGRTPDELAEAVSVQDAVLEQAAQGLLLIEDDRLTLANPRARELLGLAESALEALRQPDGRSLIYRWAGRRRRRGMPLASTDLTPPLLDLLTERQEVHEQWIVCGERTLIVSLLHASAPSNGMVAILRDHTELTRLSGQLRATTTMAQALRSQTHEHANRMHTIVALLELDEPEQARRFATEDQWRTLSLAGDLGSGIEDPVLTALLVGKASAAHERGVRLEVHASDGGSGLPLSASETVTVVGNLLDNAIEAAASPSGAQPLVEVEITRDDGATVLSVADSGPGIDPSLRKQIFVRGVSSKDATTVGGHGVGLALVGEIVQRHGGQIEVIDDGGTAFVLSFPQASTEVSAQASAGRSSGARI